MKKPNSKKNFIRNYIPTWVSLLILIVGLLTTFLVYNLANQEEETQSQKAFVQDCNEIKSKIITRINLQTEFLIGGSNLFEASESVSREEWKRYNKFSTGNIKFRGVQAIGFAPIVKLADLKKHISVTQKEGFPKYNVFPEGIRESYTPIVYLEPFVGRNTFAFGYDMYSESVRRKAMELARDKNEPVLSGKIFLVLEDKKTIQAGTVIFIPVYKDMPIQTVASRREAISGWVFCAFRMDDLMISILGASFSEDNHNIHLKIYEDSTIAPEALLFDSQKIKKENRTDLKIRTRMLPIFINGKKWNLKFSHSSENTIRFSTLTLLILICGTIISLLLSALSYTLLVTRKRAGMIAKKLTSDLKHKNQDYEKINEKLNTNNIQLLLSKEKLKTANEELQKALVRAKESDQLKSAFLANMSHEIRTPMNGIIGFAELLKNPNLSTEEHKNYVEIIGKSGNRLLSIINDIVDISKIEAGQMQVGSSVTDVNEQMQYIFTFFKPEANEKGLHFALNNPFADKEILISTDHEKLYAILINLVKNAIKYTAKGGIQFGYDIKGDHFEFYVTDTGIGISENRLKAIFERFIQADFNDKMARQGAGLGLAIAKSYVELLGGTIWVESEFQKGSTFYFTLPYVAGLNKEDIEHNRLPVNQEPSAVDKLKILVTEDDSISRMLILKTIEQFGKEILLAKTGLEALEICRNNPDLDLILMDMQMPQMNGYEATNEIRKFNSKVIIFAQTAFALEGDKEKTIEAGCNGYISKPIKKEELSNLIQIYFGQKNKV